MDADWWEAKTRADEQAWDEWHESLHANDDCHICYRETLKCGCTADAYSMGWGALCNVHRCAAIKANGNRCTMKIKYGQLCGSHYALAERGKVLRLVKVKSNVNPAP